MSSKKSPNRIEVALPANVLEDLDRIARLEKTSREKLILTAILRFLTPAAELTKAIAESAGHIKTGRYER